MYVTPHWLARCAARRHKAIDFRKRRASNRSNLDQLENRALPGSGLIASGILSEELDGTSATRKAAPYAATRHVTRGAVSEKASSAKAHATANVPSRATADNELSAKAVAQVSSSRRTVLAPDGSLRLLVSTSASSKRTPPRVDRLQGAAGLPAGLSGAKVLLANPLRLAPKRSLPAATATGYRPINEARNNVANPTWGTAGTDLLRLSPAAYANGVSSLSLPQNQSARVISDILNNQANPADPSQDYNTLDSASLSDFGYAFGQFIDHDLDLTPTDPNETLQILADPSDPSGMGNQTFDRSTYDASTGTSTSNPRQQQNAVTSYLDLSNVYGSSQAVADALRTFSGGDLKTSPGNMLPYDNQTYFTQAQINALNMANDAQAVPESSLFAAGDVRANENVELTALQTLFVRNHNLIASELQKEHPRWSDEQLYQEARKINIAEYQNTIYTQYLPDLLGPDALPAYSGYKANVDPTIATEFSTVAFRFGHSLLSSDIERQGNNGLDVLPSDPAGADISLATDFFDPNVLNSSGAVDPLTGHISTNIGPILKADADGVAQADDLLAVNDVRNLLFANGGLQDNGQDLIARDIERARDDGIGSYNQVRGAYGLPAVTSFAQITSNLTVQQELQKAYGSVSNIDPFEGGMAEDHVPGSDLGPLFTRIIADQFNRLRSGDRFFYLNESWNADELRLMKQGDTLGKMIEANTNITNLQSDVFKFTASIGGNVVSSARAAGARGTAAHGLSGVTVELEDQSGDVLATTVTSGSGAYRFNQLNGVSGTGDYIVKIVTPPGFRQSSRPAGTIAISRGGLSVQKVDFTLART